MICFKITNPRRQTTLTRPEWFCHHLFYSSLGAFWLNEEYISKWVLHILSWMLCLTLTSVMCIVDPGAPDPNGSTSSGFTKWFDVIFKSIYQEMLSKVKHVWISKVVLCWHEAYSEIQLNDKWNSINPTENLGPGCIQQHWLVDWFWGSYVIMMSICRCAELTMKPRASPPASTPLMSRSHAMAWTFPRCLEDVALSSPSQGRTARLHTIHVCHWFIPKGH